MTTVTECESVILPCDSDGFRDFMSRWPTGVTVVTTAEAAKPVGCTVNAMMSVSLNPTLLAIGLNTGTRTLDAVRGADKFAINLLSWDDQQLCQRFAKRGLTDRFAGLDYHWRGGVPLLDGVTTAVVCDVHELIECGDHTLVVGAPVWHCASTADNPLLFYHSAFRRLADKDGAR